MFINTFEIMKNRILGILLLTAFVVTAAVGKSTDGTTNPQGHVFLAQLHTPNDSAHPHTPDAFMQSDRAVPDTGGPAVNNTGLTKSDSTLLNVGNQLGVNINPNASIADIVATIQNGISLFGWPGAHGNAKQWIGFIIFWLGVFGTIYFAVKHRLLLNKHTALLAKSASVILLFVCLMTMQSCKVQTAVSNLTAWGTKHCPHSTVENPNTGNVETHINCDSVWKTKAIQAACKQIDLNIDVAHGSFSLIVECDSVLKKLPALVKKAPSGTPVVVK